MIITLSFIACRPLPGAPVDASTLHRKVITGYQGWFRCQGDAAGMGWRHWSRNGRRISPSSVTFEMWPDMSEYGDDEKYAAEGFTYPDGKPASLFSSANPKTVDRHFEWMEKYGIDGVFLQRFLVEASHPSSDLVLDNVRKAAEKHGRAYALCYDLSGHSQERMIERLVADWKRLVDDKKITADKQYLHHNQKPVLFVWGFFSDRFDAATANKMIDALKTDEKYGVTLIGGCQHGWRTETDAEWAKAFRRFDVISPWNVGNVQMIDGKKHANTQSWKADQAAAKEAKIDFLPVVYPGFGWINLQGESAARQTIPRLGGEFFWRQFVVADELDLDMVYVAMFDEVDEGTAIFKVTNDPPREAKFQTLEGLPSDWYLRLVGEGTKVIRGEQKATKELPIK
jgi:hypothetical protein